MKKIINTFLLFLSFVIVSQSQNIMNIELKDGNTLQIPLEAIDSITYVTGTSANLPVVFTFEVTSITANSARSGGRVLSNGGFPITEKGLLWGKSPNPTIADTKFTIVPASNGLSPYGGLMEDLDEDTTYYIRAYAINAAGIGYGEEYSFVPSRYGGRTYLNPALDYNYIEDIEGGTYATIVIGDQEWMAENLRTQLFKNGDTIPQPIGNEVWSILESPACASYRYKPENDIPFGKLYNWYVINDERGVCPDGWRIPEASDWDQLRDFLDVDAEGNNNFAGGFMKSTDELTWVSPNAGADNSSGFSALPAGLRSPDGIFYGIAFTDNWWSNTVVDPDEEEDDDEEEVEKIQGRYVRSNFFSLVRSNLEKNTGASIRCLKED